LCHTCYSSMGPLCGLRLGQNASLTLNNNNNNNNISPDYKTRTHKKNGDPRQSNIIKTDSSLKRIFSHSGAICIVLVPIDARCVGRSVGALDSRYGCPIANHIALFIRREIKTRVHAVFIGFRADVVPVLLHVLVVDGQRSGKGNSFKVRLDLDLAVINNGFLKSLDR